MAAAGLELPRHTEPGPFDAARWFARHYVNLQCDVIAPGHPEVQRLGLSGFVAELGGEWFLVTAGHCLTYIEELRSGGCILQQWHIDDAAGIHARDHRIGPFAFDAAAKDHYFDESLGVDYGLIHIRRLYQQQMAWNGVAPLASDAWPTRRRNFDSFWLLGIPQETVISGAHPAATQKGVRLMQLEPVAGNEVPQKMREASFQRGYLRIKSGFDDVEPLLKTIVGMSGGPVFGVRRISGKDRYWLIGIQSTWCKEHRVVAVSPVDYRLKRVLKRANGLLKPL